MFKLNTLLEISSSGTLGGIVDGLDGTTRGIIATIVLRVLFHIWDSLAKKRAEKAEKGK